MINVYIPQNYSIFHIDFVIFSLASLLLIDKIIIIILRSSNILTKLFGSHDNYNIEFSFTTILSLFIIYLLIVISF